VCQTVGAPHEWSYLKTCLLVYNCRPPAGRLQAACVAVRTWLVWPGVLMVIATSVACHPCEIKKIIRRTSEYGLNCSTPTACVLRRLLVLACALFLSSCSSQVERSTGKIKGSHQSSREVDAVLKHVHAVMFWREVIFLDALDEVRLQSTLSQRSELFQTPHLVQ
jgi:hypothetical protein